MKTKKVKKSVQELSDIIDRLEARVNFLENLLDLPDQDLDLKAKKIISLIDEVVLRKINPDNNPVQFSEACHSIARLSVWDYVKLKKEYGLRYSPHELEKALTGAFALYGSDPPKTLLLALANLYRLRTSGIPL